MKSISRIFVAFSLGLFSSVSAQFIRTQPEPQLVQAGGNAVFTVDTHSTLPLFYQWQRNGTNIPGAIRSTLTLNAVSAADIARYSVILSNRIGVQASLPAVLNVYPAGVVPFQAVTKGAGSVQFTPQGIDCGPDCNAYATNAPFRVSFASSNQWHISKLDFGCPPGEGSDLSLCKKVELAIGMSITMYPEQITNEFQDFTISAPQTARITFSPKKPVIVTQPQSQTVNKGETATFTVEATGVEPLFYEWYQGSSLSLTKTNATLTVSNAREGSAGKYHVRVYSVNHEVMVRSEDAILTVRDVPLNDAFGGSTPLRGYFAFGTMDNEHASVEAGEPQHDGTSGASLWWTWTAPMSGPVIMDTKWSSFDTFLAVYTGTALTNLVLIATDDQSGGNDTSRLTFSAIVGTTYHLAVDGYNGAKGGIQVNIRMETIEFTKITSPGGTRRFYFDAPPSRQYVLESSLDLRNWSAMETNQVSDEGEGVFVIPAGFEKTQFFRARLR